MNYTKLLKDLANVDKVIKDDDKTLTLLSSLSDDDYETFIITLINDKQSLGYNKVSDVLVNHKLRWKDKESSNSTSVEALTVREKFQSEGQR